MKTEFEVVFSEINREEIIKKIISLGGKQTKENTLMKRVVFEMLSDKRGSFLRVRDEGDKITTTYKEENLDKNDINSVSELETIVGDFDEMVSIYKKIGLKLKSYQETYREVLEINDEIELMIDLWPGLKPYIEIEGESEEVIKKYSKLLGFNYSEAIFGTVFKVYEKELGLDYDYINSLKEITFNNPPNI